MQSAHSVDLEATRAAVASVARELATAGLVLGSAGNVSARVGDLLAITPTGAELITVATDDITVIDLDGAVVGDGRAPTSELDLHLGAYRRYGAGAVVHTHSPAATALACVLDELPCIHYGMLALGGDVRVAPYRTFGTRELAEVTLDALEGRSAALMANHGTLTIGDDISHAMAGSRLLEWAAQLYINAASVGTPRRLSRNDLDAVREAILARSDASAQPA